MVGSKMYMAPEIIDRSSHSKSCDLWSIGIIMFLMLADDYPFDFKNLDHEICNEPVIFLPKKWEGVSQLAKDLITGLLDKDPSSRLSAI